MNDNQNAISKYLSEILLLLGEDPDREGLKKTPERVARSLAFLTQGNQISASDVVKDALFDAPSQGLVLQREIEFYSLCEHHILPFFGKIHVAYQPSKKVIGLSKVGRVIDVYARRLQLQERLTEQVADALERMLEPAALAVIVEASHFCMMMRGVQKQSSCTMTSAYRGVFQSDIAARQEVNSLLMPSAGAFR